jgi:hypothetical protein
MVGFHQNVHQWHGSEILRHIKISLHEILKKLNHWIQLLVAKVDLKLHEANIFLKTF